jgi:hypothetical protein
MSIMEMVAVLVGCAVLLAIIAGYAHLNDPEVIDEEEEARVERESPEEHERRLEEEFVREREESQEKPDSVAE